MSRFKKTVALKVVSKSGAQQPEIQADKIHRFPVIVTWSGLLPMDAFGERILRVNRFHERFNYAHFVNGKNKGNFGRNRLEHMNDEANQLLDLLENGIFGVLLRGVLHAVQFTVIADEDSPNKVLETYTFTFDNLCERGTTDRLTNSPRMDFFSPYEDRARMRNMIFEGKALIRPTVENNRSLGIHVFYKPECSRSYDVPGFADFQDNTIEYPRTSYWETTRRFYGSVDSDFHTLRVNSLLSTSPDGEGFFPSVEEANDDIMLRSDEVGIPTPAQMPLDVVGEIYVFSDESTAGATDGKYASLLHFERVIRFSILSNQIHDDDF
ncbi:DNA-binding HORMA [Penicillium hordei]|uniref:DNA-binding HORMA n=1 Tax=Penicillium hordei TaxID=40994 RepID=A0AAD6E020_9EURO|nr:DNA-binding HORMA [Penicillium hordei]KAJ5597403.1 DNA-binding HORMA [Penicillium hordei]